MLIIEWVHEAHAKLWGLAGTDLKPAFDDANKMLCSGSILGFLCSPCNRNSI